MFQILKLSLFSLTLFFSMTLQAQDSRLFLDHRDIEKRNQQTHQMISQAIRYLDNNPKKISDVMPVREYRRFRQAFLSGNIKRYLDNLEEKIIRVGKEKIRTQPKYTNLIDFAHRLELSRDERHVKSHYLRLYQSLPKKYQRRVTHPKVVLNAELNEAISYLDKIVGIISHIDFQFNLPPTKPDGWTEDCSNEIGAEENLPHAHGDRANRCGLGDFAENSLYKKANFPLKYYHTCIKSQGRRGTCVAFAINSMIESKLLIEEDLSYNFSQQFTYFFGSIYSYESSRYSYGLPTGYTLHKMNHEDVQFQYESIWRYNQSFEMDKDMNDENQYEDSCLDYLGPVCTDYSFQAFEIFVNREPNQSRVYLKPSLETSESFEITGHGSLLGLNTTDSEGLDSAIALLNDKEPILVSYNIQESFRNVGNDGIVHYNSEDEGSGGHASVLLGFVYNEDLPENYPEANEKGYFILKNSWGTWNGDCGYYYVDYEYLRENLRQLFYIDV